MLFLVGSRLDTWFSALTGLGGARDKRLYATFTADTILDDATLESLYHHNDLAALICDILPEDATRRGFLLSIEDDTDLQTAIQMRADELELTKKVCDAAIWGRVFGAAALFIGADDGSNVGQPLIPEKVKELKFLTVLDKRDLQPVEWYTDPLDGKYGTPKTYRFTLSTRGAAPNNTVVHESRLVFFYGARTSKRLQLQNNGWPYSVLQKVYEVLRDFGLGWSAATYLMQEASQGVYAVKDLIDILASEGGEERLEQRFRLIDMSKSVARSLVIDAEHESYTRVPVAFTGVPDTLDRFATRLSAATRIPITRLMGQSPGGMNATGESDADNWNRVVKSYQEMELGPAFEKIVLLLLLEAGKEPENWKVSFPPLSEPSEKETADVRKVTADTDAIYMDRGVVFPEEIAASRWGAEGYSSETTIDLDVRKEAEIETEEINPTTGAPLTEDIQKQAPNGAQTASMIDIVARVAAKEIPRSSGVAMLMLAFPWIDLAQAESIVSDAGGSFEAVKPEPPPAFGAKKEIDPKTGAKKEIDPKTEEE